MSTEGKTLRAKDLDVAGGLFGARVVRRGRNTLVQLYVEDDAVNHSGGIFNQMVTFDRFWLSDLETIVEKAKKATAGGG